MTNFTECSERFQALSNSTYSNYTYNGPVRGILAQANRTAFITLAGCRHLCGTGSDYYLWKESSATITTWVLPILGLMLQAPYESNEFWQTIWATARWVGSPVAALSYTLWNIKVTGKCAMMVDMASPYGQIPRQDSPFGQMRDSLYILSVMNQYAIKQRMPAIPAERLLRIALFSDSLQLTADPERTSSLIRRRAGLAERIRQGRKKGVVPVFVSLMWFLFSLAISIQAAFGQIGENATAHSLAMGCLLGWVPVLIMTSIVDRNPVSAVSVRLELNSLLDDVRLALLDPDRRNTYMAATGRTQEDFDWTNALNNEDYFHQDFFTQFAGQGRVRWHYGVAHPILASIESSFMADYGRDWLRDPEGARTAMVLGPHQLRGLRWFDFRMIWQIISAVCIVFSTVGGAFVISYFTPTVGLGCRSGGYVIFVVIALGVFVVELLVWWLTPDGSSLVEWVRYRQEDPIARWSSNVGRRLSRTDSNGWFARSKLRALTLLNAWNDMSFRDCMEVLFLRPCEIVNMGWLVYIVTAQTFGSYKNCDCQASIWGSHGGYIDFESSELYREHGVYYYWGSGTALTCSVLTVSLFFIVVEYCTQSHLSTESYESASHGLWAVRKYKKYTYYFRRVPDYFIDVVKRIFHQLLGNRVRGGRRSLVWRSTVHRHHPPPPRLVIGRPAAGNGDDGDSENIPLTSPTNMDRRDSRSSMGGSISSDNGSLQRPPVARANLSFGSYSSQ